MVTRPINVVTDNAVHHTQGGGITIFSKIAGYIGVKIIYK